MTRSQELAQFHIREAEIEHEAELDRLRDTVAEKEQEIAELRAELAERDVDLTDVQNRITYLAPVEPLLHALHAALLAQDVHLSSTINGYHLIIGDVTISARSPRANDVVMAAHRVALDFTGEDK